MRQKSFFLDPREIQRLQKQERKKEKKQSSTSSQKKSEHVVYDCDSCGLYKRCHSPKIGLAGEGKKKILLIGQAPGRVEDQHGISFIGPAGKLLREVFSEVQIDVDKDCWRINSVRCYPGQTSEGGDIPPSYEQIMCCHSNLMETINSLHPALIICLGDVALQATLRPWLTQGVGSLHGLTFPIHEFDCWVGVTFHPARFLYQNDGVLNHKAVMVNDIQQILKFHEKSLPERLKKEDNILLTNLDEILSLIETITNISQPVAFDYETSQLSPYVDTPEVLTVGVSFDKSVGFCFPVDKKENGEYLLSEEERMKVREAWIKFLASSTPKVVQNINMEDCWSRRVFGQPLTNFIWDTMIGSHILYCRSETTGLKFQAFLLAGQLYDIDRDAKSNINSLSIEEIGHYNCFDARFTIWAYQHQIEEISAIPSLQIFSDTYMKIAPVLSEMRDRGVKIDIDELEKITEEYIQKRDAQIARIKACPTVKKYEEETGKTFLWTSASQIGKILYSYMKIPVKYYTQGGKPSTDQKILPQILEETSDPEVKEFIDAILQYRKIEGSNGILQRVKNFLNCADDKGFLHPEYTLHIAATYRSSAVDPNIQNIPKHDPDQQCIRKALVAEEGRVLLACDMSSLEVRIIAMESQDPVLIHQLENKIDFHRDWAEKLYAASKYNWEDLSDSERKLLRYNTKNGFVFASFYGSIPKSIAKYDAFVEAEIPLSHVERVQEEFWKTYARVKQWQNSMIEQYNQNGWIETLPGFRRPGILSLFQIYNNPTQGTGFVLFADGLRRINEELHRRNLKSYIVTEIHDSMIFQAVPEEIPTLIEISSEILESRRFPWHTVSTPVEWEIGNSWADLKPLDL